MRNHVIVVGQANKLGYAPLILTAGMAKNFLIYMARALLGFIPDQPYHL